MSPQARFKHELVSKEQTSPSSQFHLPVYIMKKEFYTYVLPHSIRSTLHLPADLKTYPQETLQGSKSLEAAEGLKRMCLSPSFWHFLYERKNSFPFPQPGILIKPWIPAKSLPPYLAGVDYFSLILLCRSGPPPATDDFSPWGKVFAGQGSLPAGAGGNMGEKAKGWLRWQGTTVSQVIA